MASALEWTFTPALLPSDLPLPRCRRRLASPDRSQRMAEVSTSPPHGADHQEQIHEVHDRKDGIIGLVIFEKAHQALRCLSR